MDAWRNIWVNLNWGYLSDLLLNIIPSLICITFHEVSHGLVAYKLGDDTAKRQGRLTLNPIRHIDIFGLLMMVVFRFGWAKPVPVNMRNFKNPKAGMAITALAGPVSNFLLCIVVLFLYGLLYIPLVGNSVGNFVLETLYLTAYISLALGIFNLIPIPPLDGSKVVFSALSDEGYWKLMRYERYGMILLLVVVATGILGGPLQRATVFLFNHLLAVAQWGLDLVQHFV